MTRSFGGGGRQGGRGGGPPGGRPGGQRPGGQQGGQQFEEPQQSPSTEMIVRPEFGKRTVAIVIDFAACYFIGAAFAMIPFLSAFIPLQFVMVMLLLSRDFFFEGRGIGKNLMGLQVIDAASGQPCSLVQSIVRNAVLIAPFLVLQILSLVLKFVPIAMVTETIVNLVTLAGMIYCAVVVPLEAYRVYSNPAGTRFGDDFAGTAIVEAPMDFSRILPR